MGLIIYLNEEEVKPEESEPVQQSFSTQRESNDKHSPVEKTAVEVL